MPPEISAIRNRISKLSLTNKISNRYLCFNEFARTVIFQDCRSGSSGEGARLRSDENHRLHGPHSPTAGARLRALPVRQPRLKHNSTPLIFRACRPGSGFVPHLPRTPSLRPIQRAPQMTFNSSRMMTIRMIRLMPPPP